MTLNRLFLICLATLAGVWIWLFGVDVAERASDRAFHTLTVAPALHSQDAAARDRAVNEFLARAQRRNRNSWVRANVFFGALALMMAWTITNAVRTEAFWKRRNRPTRMADANAGAVVAAIQGQEKLFIARTSRGRAHLLPYREQTIEVNFPERTVTFRNFRFLTSFFGPKLHPETTLQFADILGGRTWISHGHSTAQLRTTAGKVTIPDNVQPFDAIVAVLFDLAEANRKDPVAFAAALAREPRIRTPWYGWLIAALACASVAALLVLLWRMTVK